MTSPLVVAISPPTPFEQVVSRAWDIVSDAVTGDWQTIAALNDLPDAVYIKNAEGVLVEVNDAYLREFCPDGSPLGRSGTAFLDKSILEVSQQTDSLIVGGTNRVECEHVARLGDGRLCTVRTHKRSLAELGNPGLAILGVSRRERVLDDDEAAVRVKLADQNVTFRAMDESDRQICRLLGRGAKVREIADELQLTSRAVEQRKRRILETLELDQTIDLVKLLVRLQDGGFVDLGL